MTGSSLGTIQKTDRLNYLTSFVRFVSLLLAAFLMGGCEKNATKSDLPFYSLEFGSNTKVVHSADHSVLSAEGGNRGEEIIFILNGHPLVFLWNKEVDFAISDYLKKDTNTLKIETELDTSADLLITRFEDGTNKVVTHHMILPHETNRIIEFPLECQICDPHSFEHIQIESKEERRQIQDQILPIIEELNRLIQQGEGKAAAEILFEGYQMNRGLGLSETEMLSSIDSLKKIHANMIIEGGASCPEIDLREIKLLYGQSSIYAYLDWDSDGFNNYPYIFTIEDNEGDELHLYPLRFSLLAGEWVIWRSL